MTMSWFSIVTKTERPKTKGGWEGNGHQGVSRDGELVEAPSGATFESVN